jgi:hypothetical protein
VGKENRVLVGAKEINVDTKGKADTVELMETWRINKDGKADRFTSLTGMPGENKTNNVGCYASGFFDLKS